jgi:uncharacterized protein YaiL (DUF2058 family)
MGLGDLKSQLLKAGLVSKKQVQRVQHEKKQARKKKGRKAIEAEETAKRERREAELKAQREADRERSLATQAKQGKREQLHRLVQMAQSGSVRPGRPRNRRWYFIARDGRVPFLNLDDATGRKLELGRLALVEAPDGRTWIVVEETAQRIREVDPAWIRVWKSQVSG